MRIESKFMTADVRLTTARLEGNKLVTEGLVKEFMPVKMEMDPQDVRLLLRLLLDPLMNRIRVALPKPLRGLLSQFAVAAQNHPLTQRSHNG